MTTHERDIQISLHDVRFQYAGSTSEALAGVSLEVVAGEHLCILGGNGSGKSTLAQLMNALLVPTAGAVEVLGRDPLVPEEAFEIRRQVAMVFQHPEDQMVTSIVADDVAFGPENLGVSPDEIARRVDRALNAVDMAEHAQTDPTDLSGGQKQRIAIAGALAMEPRILLLDEPGAMLDAAGRAAIRDIIERLHAQGITVIHITHFMDDALQADRVLVMDQGRIALEGAPEQVFAETELVRSLGLELPFSLQLAERLGERGYDVPRTAKSDRLAAILARKLAAGRPRCVPEDAAAPAAMAATPQDAPAISFDDVSFSYVGAASARKKARWWQKRKRRPANAPLALAGVSFSAAPGSLVALIGRTGSGKSTTAELACALKVPADGRVTIAGIDTRDLSRRRELRSKVGYVSQLPERQLFAETVYDDVAFGPRNLGLSEEEVRDRVVSALAMTGLTATDDLLARSPFALSGGQQRSVALAGILAMKQPVLVLDEPMAGLDPIGRASVRSLLLDLKRRGTTLLLVTHSMDDVAELADRVIVLDRGRKVADGTPREVFAPSICNRRSGTKPAAELTSIRFCDALPDTRGQNRIETRSESDFASLLRLSAAPGIPSALAFAAQLAQNGAPEPLANAPLTLDELVQAIPAAETTEEAMAHGAAR